MQWCDKKETVRWDGKRNLLRVKSEIQLAGWQHRVAMTWRQAWPMIGLGGSEGVWDSGQGRETPQQKADTLFKKNLSC